MDAPVKSASEKSPRKSALGRADWIKAGLKLLGSAGPEAVLVAPLAAKLGVTKGSFYWHFASRDELLAGILEEWRTHATRRVIEISEGHATSARDKIRLLAYIGSASSIDELGGSLELAMRSWARSNKKVRSTLAEIDAQRISYLTTLYKEIGGNADPELLACLHYSFSSGLRLNFAYTDKQKLAMRDLALEQIFFADLAPPAKG